MVEEWRTKRDMKVEVQVESTYNKQHHVNPRRSRSGKSGTVQESTCTAHTVQRTRVEGRSRKFGVDGGRK